MRIIGFVLATVALATSAWAGAAPTPPRGKGQFRFTRWAGPPLRVFYYRPPGAAGNAPIVLVMHGTNRDARRYRDEWAPLARERGFIVVAPQFDRTRFPGVEGYNLGGARDRRGRPVPRRRWTFAAIEPLFDEVRTRFGSMQPTYYLYGHSAGGQFVHRFVMHMGHTRLRRAFAANAGWYLMPDPKFRYPYGVADSGISARRLRSALTTRLTVLVGERDVVDDGNVRRSRQASMQGENRRARGHAFIEAAKARAAALRVATPWTLSTVADAGHENLAMARAAAPLIRPRLKAPPATR
ncbi:hypothetical protein N0B51_10215 [Tsuneonella sp. YG55]|uniref:Alpha/beta hydrolase family protein n=1 Tax=Tsuneonella litorea TaxID=2976475 RepID=A0A9X3AN78_9SPHN|nr:hypothetical protein [Tsuneonella litorea]MCT2559352.1 hypothetical protein [Tsuneonella litorea]